MTRTRPVFFCGMLLLGTGCTEGARVIPESVDCSVSDQYEFRRISDFEGDLVTGKTGWFQYSDATPTPGALPDGVTTPNVPISPIPEGQGHCSTWLEGGSGETRTAGSGMMRLEAQGRNFYGAGFGDWVHGNSPADGTGYEGVSFWVRSPGNTDKTFMFYADDGRTIIVERYTPGNGPDNLAVDANNKVMDQDLDGDKYLTAGDIANGTTCRLPPTTEMSTAPCYNIGTAPPAATTRVPAVNECGNPFHTFVDTTEEWQLIRIPWRDLAQWPCPNRLASGINEADIRKFEVKFVQGTVYDVWLDDIMFYRRRADDGN